MTQYENRDGLQVAAVLAEFIETKALPGTGVSAQDFWSGFAQLVGEFGPRNQDILDQRTTLQKQIDVWHRSHKDSPHNAKAYKAFLQEIGYLLPEGDAFEIETSHIDPEIATIAGSQLVVPVTNARFALNAANARWGSLYDAFYGTDAIGMSPKAGPFDQGRGSRVVSRCAVFLDEAFPVEETSHGTAKEYRIEGGNLLVDGGALIDPSKFAGYSGSPETPDAILLKNNGLHVELTFDRNHPIGKNSPSGLADVAIESAISAIIDCEDSVACVDAPDKVLAYHNWLGLMQGDLAETFEKGGKSVTRKLNEDRVYNGPNGGSVTVKGRALLLVRNVGHLMTNPAGRRRSL